MDFSHKAAFVSNNLKNGPSRRWNFFPLKYRPVGPIKYYRIKNYILLWKNVNIFIVKCFQKIKIKKN